MSAGNQFLLALFLHLLACATVIAGRRLADVISALLACAGSAFGISASLSALLSAHIIPVLRLPWLVPGGEFVLELDGISAAFLLIIFAVSALGRVYGLSYWSRAEQPRTATSLRLFFEVLTIALAVVVTARNTLFFLLAWEIMAVSAFFLVATEEQHDEVRRGAWLYLIASHIGTAFILGAFVLLRLETGSFLLGGQLAPSVRLSLIFVLALLGFGLKAGLAPLHFWLPGAHANAPSHVSALMSGVMLKAGIYGILRITALAASPPMWWALLLGAIACVTALLGISLAFGQIDLKRALAYSSVENIGIICIGIALALAGRAAGQPLWVVLGMAGAIAHVWNHSAFKSLLFLASGGVVHATGTRNMEQLGGLMKRMPHTAWAFIIGGLAAAGLPLLNGFISEWLIALGIFEGIRGGAAQGWYLALAGPVLAVAGALALASFVRIIGIVFLGEPRTDAALAAHESPWLMRAPLVVLALICVATGIFPVILSRPLEAVTVSWAGGPTAQLSGFLRLPMITFGIVTVFLIVLATTIRSLAGKQVRVATTWDCGYARPTTRMQYTSRSFGEWITDRFLPHVLQPDTEIQQAQGLFPANAAFQSGSADPVVTHLYEPFVHRWASRFKRLRWVQQGNLTIYLVYIFITTIVLFAWTSVRSLLP